MGSGSAQRGRYTSVRLPTLELVEPLLDLLEAKLVACLVEVLAGFRVAPTLALELELDDIKVDDEDAAMHPTDRAVEIADSWLQYRRHRATRSLPGAPRPRRSLPDPRPLLVNHLKSASCSFDLAAAVPARAQ